MDADDNFGGSASAKRSNASGGAPVRQWSARMAKDAGVGKKGSKRGVGRMR